MIYSMTGFGSARTEAPNLTALAEIKSVNHRYLDVHVKIPGEFQNFENIIRQRISVAFKRGRLDAFVRIDYQRENIKLDVNHNLIRAFVEHYRQQLMARVTELAPQLAADSGHRLETEALLMLNAVTLPKKPPGSAVISTSLPA